MKKIPEIIPKNAVEECPFYDECQENKCPLHIDYSILKTTIDDRALHGYKACKLSKFQRMKIAKNWGLKNNGLKRK